MHWKRLSTQFLAALMVCMLTTAAVPLAYAGAANAVFRDTARHWGDDAIGWAVENGIVDGFGDGTFRPDARVSEPEFLAMLLRAYPEASNLSASAPGTAWYDAYYAAAAAQGWSVVKNTDRNRYTRGHVALLIARSQRDALTMTEAIRYLLDNGLSQGKTAATVEGYRADDGLTRAEAVQFVRLLKDRRFQLIPSGTAEPPAVSPSSAVRVKGIGIGDSAEAVRDKLGAADRIDASEYGFDWHVFLGGYNDYAMIGIRSGKVVALYSPAGNWAAPTGIVDGSTRSNVVKQYGEPIHDILKGNTRFIQNYGHHEYGTYAIDGSYVTFFYDIHDSEKIAGMQAVEASAEQSLAAFYATGTPQLEQAYERQTFDLANVARVRRGLTALEWDESIANVARKHSRSMAEQGFFAHQNPDGQSPFDRMEADGILFRAAAENIAAGQTSGIFAHHGWMNSEGHRTNILGDTRRLGTGVVFGGHLHVYYTQNFYTPTR